MQFLERSSWTQKNPIYHLGAADLRKVFDSVYGSQVGFFYLLAVSYGRLQEDDDEVTVPLLSASKSRSDEENLTGLLNLCSLSIVEVILPMLIRS